MTVLLYYYTTHNRCLSVMQCVMHLQFNITFIDENIKLHSENNDNTTHSVCFIQHIRMFRLLDRTTGLVNRCACLFWVMFSSIFILECFWRNTIEMKISMNNMQHIQTNKHYLTKNISFLHQILICLFVGQHQSHFLY